MISNVSFSTVSNFLVKAWSIIGPLVGLLIGAWLSRSWQRKQWVLEGKKAEYRELISTLSQSYHCILKNWPALIAPFGEVICTLTDGAQQRETLEAEVAGQRVIEDRIFIDKAMRAENVREQWALLAAEKDLMRIYNYWTSLHDVLVKMAHRDLGIKN